MPKTIIITALGPGEIIETTIKQARKSSDRVLKLIESDLSPTESLVDRLKEIARESRRLAEAFQAFDQTMQAAAEAALNDSPASTSDDHPRSQGCATGEGDLNVN